ncbi:D-alanine--D-alanine ligase family protein [Georgenia sp. Z1344]|uniref:D-alanine--D-alanine ligase family protein n=1 Tax=Georgenia sp. Z1344 TaxID=3416706 RepID=UPI003CF68E9D
MTIETPATDRRIRVALVFGGRSGEHEISCATAAGVMRALDPDRYEIVPVGITREGRWVQGPTDPATLELAAHGAVTEGADVLLRLDGGRELVVEDSPAADAVAASGPTGSAATGVESAAQGLRALGRVDVVLPLLHGPFGEDGTLQGLLEMADVPYVGSGVLASAAGMDKDVMKVLLAARGLPVGPYVSVPARRWATEPDAVRAEVAALGLPLFVKPARAGSSIGISKVADLAELDAAIDQAHAHDPKVVVEAGIDGREIECGVLGGRGTSAPRASLPGEIVLDGAPAGFYDYEAKYVDTDGLEMAVPADIPEHVAARVRELAVRAFDAMGCEGLARVDFFVDGETIVVNEINTMPGFTPFSMFPVVWEASGVPYGELLDELITLALARPVGLR